jgi:CheY-like chemotaxis protein
MNTPPVETKPAFKKIFIVDDEPAFTHMVKRALESTGQFAVLEENLAISALPAARKFKPDLILLDVIMPVIDGGDIAGHLAADPVLKSIPVIFLTATVSSREAGARGLRSGGRLFLSKPVELETLVKHINETLAPLPPPPPKVQETHRY